MSARRLLRSGTGAVALAAALVLGACEGDNLFSGEVAGARPRVLDLDVPATAAVPGTITVDVTAVADRGLDEIRVLYSGALNDDRRFQFDGERTVQIVSDEFQLDTAADSLLIVTATATDVGGQTSLPVVDTIRVN